MCIVSTHVMMYHTCIPYRMFSYIYMYIYICATYTTSLQSKSRDSTVEPDFNSEGCFWFRGMPWFIKASTGEMRISEGGPPCARTERVGTNRMSDARPGTLNLKLHITSGTFWTKFAQYLLRP